VQWVKDRTGRFAQRPHYQPHELDQLCEGRIVEFLERRGTIHFPISTDALTVLVEESTSDLDVYADLSSLGTEIQGVTDFIHGERPSIRISRDLTADQFRENRLRTTLTHELGHADLHSQLFFQPQSSLFTELAQERLGCNREAIEGPLGSDWMEWQANYASTAYLMPISYVTQTARTFLASQTHTGRITSTSSVGVALINQVAGTFRVSRQATEIRLRELRFLTGDAKSFDIPTLL
jgi:hypothetical protein